VDGQDVRMAVIAAIKVAYGVLAERWLTLISMLMTFGLYAWAMYLASWLHFAIAGAFGITIFLPVLLGGRSKRTVPNEPRQEA
jgi:hypothetical protein